MLQQIKDIYSESIQIQISASSLLTENIAEASQKVIQCLLSGNKVIACGIARSYANAQFLVSNLLNRYDIERPSFPSVLTGSNNDAIQGLLAEQDLEISIPTHKESRILENHLFVINAICEIIDHTLFPRVW